MSYDIEYVAAVITTVADMREKMEVADYINFFSPTQREMIADILYDLDLVTEEWREFSLWDDRFDSQRGEYVKLWKITE